MNKFDQTKLKKINEINSVVYSEWELEQALQNNEGNYGPSSLCRDVLDISKKHNIDLFVKLMSDKETLGAILFERKKSGEYFNKEDRSLLKTIAFQAGVAIEKARLYKEVKDYSKNLEKKVKNRTAKIEGMQKEQKQMMLEIAHRLQTPLTVLKGDLEIARKSLKNSKKLDKFENSINKLSKFIYDILKLARLENNGDDIKKEKIDLSVLVKELSEYFEVVMREKKIKLHTTIDKNLSILGDGDKIEELITNLVSNSVKYIGVKKNKMIDINLSRVNNKKAVLKISDNGIGIEKEEQANLFTRFYRSKNVNNTQVEGTGLGLVISKKIADVHGIEIKLDSEINKGTSIILEFRCL